MLGEPRVPYRRDAVADLIDGAQLPPLPAPHQPSMPAMVSARQQLDNERALAVAARRQHDALILPLHDLAQLLNSRPIAL